MSEKEPDTSKPEEHRNVPRPSPLPPVAAPLVVERGEPVRLNLGAGDVQLDGYTNIDIKRGQQAYPLDVPDESVDEIRASHLLEHFGHNETVPVLKQWASKLRPGGILVVKIR